MKKQAVVTGGSSGIGKAISVELAKRGFDILIINRTRSDHLRDTITELNSCGVAADSLQYDLENLTELDRFCTQIMEKLGGSLDVLVNNAACALSQSFQQCETSQINELFNVNLLAPVLLTRNLIPALKTAQGCVINISSINAARPVKGGVLYSTTKAGLETFTRASALELGQFGIRVNCIAPGCTDTPMLTSVTSQEIRDMIAMETPLGRLGTPTDIAKVAGFLVSDDASWLTGETITASGGLY